MTDSGPSRKRSNDHVDKPTKTPRLDPMEAIARADEFEQEASREIAATKGLDGGDEGKMKLVHQVRHQVAIPPNYPYTPIAQHKRLDPPVRTYKFELDPFQHVSTSCIERNESVLVSAHTSAGKTVVAEFAIATCLKEGRRVVYTSPIKVSTMFDRC